MAKQTDIGYVKDPRYHYRLDLKDEVPIQAKPMRFRPKEEAWLDAHLDELIARGSLLQSCLMKAHSALHPYSWCQVNNQAKLLEWCRISYLSISRLWNISTS